MGRPLPRTTPTGARLAGLGAATAAAVLLSIPGTPAAGDAPASAREPTGEDTGTERRGAATPSWATRDPWGTRRVPSPRGASARRAKRLGIGGLRDVRRIFREGPSPQLRTEAAFHGRMGTGPLHWPVDGGRFGRGFGYVRRSRPELRHDGIDVGAPRGAVVRSVGPGLVVFSDNRLRGLGNTVVIVHPNGLVSLYAHQQRTTVQPGWRVRRGERIGFVGDSGIARGPHLHFELRDGHRLVDPMEHLRAPDRAGSAQVELGPDGRIARVAGLALGEPSTALRLLRQGIPPALAEAAEGRTFPTWLWPTRGGRPARGFGDGHRGLDVTAEPGTPVRAAADGLVVYVGDGLPGLGEAVLLVHPMGSATVYGGVREVAFRVGERVLRGEWLAEVAPDPQGAAAPHLHFAAYEDGSPVDPTPRLRGTPSP